MGWLWPVGVGCPFDVPFGVLAFDDAGERSGSSFGVETPCEEGGGGLPEPGELPFRGKSRPVGRCHGRFGVQQRTRPGLGLGRR